MMHSLAPRPHRDGFTRLALATTIATYLLIAVGALVRAAGAGLGCPDWPRCFGRWVPPTRAEQLPAGFDPAQFDATNTWIEYLNRLTGVVIGLLIFATLIAAWRRYRRQPHVFWPSLMAFLLVGFQGWLGGRVVADELKSETLTLHLLVALIIVGLLQYAFLGARYCGREGAAPVPKAQRWVGRAALAVAVLVLIQVAVGTEVRSLLQDLEKLGVPRSEWLPLGFWPDIAHRQLGLVVTMAAAALAFASHRSTRWHHGLRGWSLVVLALCLVQILLGLGLAYGGVPAVLQVLHLSVASLLFGAVSVVVFQAYRVRVP